MKTCFWNEFVADVLMARQDLDSETSFLGKPRLNIMGSVPDIRLLAHSQVADVSDFQPSEIHTTNYRSFIFPIVFLFLYQFFISFTFSHGIAHKPKSYSLSIGGIITPQHINSSNYIVINGNKVTNLSNKNSTSILFKNKKGKPKNEY